MSGRARSPNRLQEHHRRAPQKCLSESSAVVVVVGVIHPIANLLQSVEGSDDRWSRSVKMSKANEMPLVPIEIINPTDLFHRE